MYNTARSNPTHPDGSGECGSLDEFVAEDKVTLGFRHLDVVPAVGAGGSGPSRFSAGLAILDIERPEFALPRVGEGLLQAADKSAENGLLAPGLENSADPIIRARERPCSRQKRGRSPCRDLCGCHAPRHLCQPTVFAIRSAAIRSALRRRWLGRATNAGAAEMALQTRHGTY